MRAAVSAMFLMNGFVVGSWAPLVPELGERHGLSESAIGLMILALGFGSLIVMPISGALIARFGARPVLRLTCIFVALALLPVGLAPNVAVLATVMFFFGGMIGSMDIAMNANAVVVEQRLSRAIMSSCHGFWSLGGLIGAASGGLLIDRLGADMQVSIVTVIALLLALAFVGRIAADLPISEETRPKFQLTLKPMPYVVGLMALCSMVPEGAILDWGALYLREELGANATLSGLAFGAVAATMALMRFAGDAVRQRFGAVQTIRWSAIVACIGLLTAAMANGPGMAIAGFALSGLGIANIVPVALSAAGNLPGLPPGVGISIATCMGYSGILLAPALVGFVAEYHGFSIAFFGMACLFMVVLSMSSVARRADIGSVQAAPAGE